MNLSIISITYNNLGGLKRTVESVMGQNYRDWELIVVDGGSTDGTKGWLEDKANEINSNDMSKRFRFVSEPDSGIYNAQNKGIGLAKGEYCYFLNAGDVFCNDYVLEKMILGAQADIIYGNEIIVDARGNKVEVCKGVENPTFLDLYMSCMKHQATFIRRSLFEKYGVYDESLRIVADWEWFFRVLAYHDDITLQYKDVDVSLFENTGMSYHSPELCRTERQLVLDRYMSRREQADYAIFSKYPRLRKANSSAWGRFALRLINKFAKL